MPSSYPPPRCLPRRATSWVCLAAPTRPGAVGPGGRREAVLLSIGFGFLTLSAGSMAWAGLQRSPAVSELPDFLLLLPGWAVSAWLLHRSLDRGPPARAPPAGAARGRP